MFSSLSRLGKAIAKAHFLEAFLFGVMLLLRFSSTMANATTLYHLQLHQSSSFNFQDSQEDFKNQRRQVQNSSYSFHYNFQTLNK